MPVKALGGGDGEGNTAALIKAIRYAEDNGASICNLSLTSPTNDQALYCAIRDSSMLFVAAAGNDGKDIDRTPVYPASYELDNVISAANISCGGELHESSNYGVESVDLAAPGSYILSTTPGNTYSYMTGTSMAAPMVTGAAAMVWSHFDGIGAAEVKEILLNSVTPLDSLSGKVKTGGMLNVGAALRYDLGTLSGKAFEAGGHRPENGTAPHLEARTERTLAGLYLKVRVVDIDGDLDVLYYAPGERNAEWFREREDCQSFTVSDRDIAAFRIDPGGRLYVLCQGQKGQRYGLYRKDRRSAGGSGGPGPVNRKPLFYRGYGRESSQSVKQRFFAFWYSLLPDHMDPALGRFDAAHLDAGQGIVKLLGDGTHFFHAAGQADLVSMVHDLSDGRDHCGGPGQRPASANSFTSSKGTSLSSAFKPR